MITCCLVLQDEVLIGEFGAINRLATASISVGKVSSLDHELGTIVR